MIITPIDEAIIERIQLKDKTTSTILTIAIPVLNITAILGIIVDQSLKHLSFNFSN